MEIKDFTTGSPARGEDFFFRRAFIDDLWDLLKKEHVLLLAPRRMGKTSVMLRLQDEPRQDRLVVFLNVEELATPAEFCQSLITAILEQHPEYLRQKLAKGWSFLAGIFKNVQNVELSGFKIALRESEENWDNDWKTKAEELIEQMRRTQRPLLLIIDELPDMILGMQKQAPEKLEPFLHWFRATRQSPRQDTIRWLVGGSVNLTSTLDRQGKINLINDFRVEPLPPFSAKEVKEFVTEMLESRKVPFQANVIAKVQELLGKPIPFFLQLLTQELYRDWRVHQKKLAPRHVESVFQRVLLGEAARDKLKHFHSRIQLYYPDTERAAALELLNQVCRSNQVLTRDALFTVYAEIEARKPRPRHGQDLKQAFYNLLLLLQNDFYVEEDGDQRFDFTSTILKLWWRKYYG